MAAFLETVLETIRARRAEIEERYGVRLIGVVGSVARGEERADSDVDIAYEDLGRGTLFDLANAMGDLEDEIGRSVDLVNIANARPEAQKWFYEDLARA